MRHSAPSPAAGQASIGASGGADDGRLLLRGSLEDDAVDALRMLRNPMWCGGIRHGSGRCRGGARGALGALTGWDTRHLARCRPIDPSAGGELLDFRDRLRPCDRPGRRPGSSPAAPARGWQRARRPVPSPAAEMAEGGDRVERPGALVVEDSIGPAGDGIAEQALGQGAILGRPSGPAILSRTVVVAALAEADVSPVQVEIDYAAAGVAPGLRQIIAGSTTAGSRCPGRRKLRQSATDRTAWRIYVVGPRWWHGSGRGADRCGVAGR
jgi:hypothetical protein